MIDEQPVPIYFFSKKLTNEKYYAFDREHLDAYFAILYFKHFLDGRNVVLC